MRIIVHVMTNRIGSKDEREIEIEDDIENDDIDDIARDTMFEMIEWGWEKKE